MRSLSLCGLVLPSLAILALAGPVQAQIVYSATDFAAGPSDPHPNSDAAAAAFDAAAAGLGSAHLIDFESAPVGSFSSLTAAPGVTVTGVDFYGNPLYINNAPNLPAAPALDGFNTTPGGSNYLELLGGTATFTFSTPVSAFGAYFTGVQPGFFQDVITFSDGSSQTVNVPADDSFSGGVSFAGFTDAGKLISQISIQAGNSNSGDFIGIDDVRFVTAGSVPEPGSVAMLVGMGIAGAGCLTRRRKNSR